MAPGAISSAVTSPEEGARRVTERRAKPVPMAEKARSSCTKRTSATMTGVPGPWASVVGLWSGAVAEVQTVRSASRFCHASTAPPIRTAETRACFQKAVFFNGCSLRPGFGLDLARIAAPSPV